MNEKLVQEIAEAVAERLVGRPQPRLLSVQGAADYLSRSEQSVRNLIKRGIIPRTAIDGRVQVDIRDLDSMIDRSKERAI